MKAGRVQAVKDAANAQPVVWMVLIQSKSPGGFTVFKIEDDILDEEARARPSYLEPGSLLRRSRPSARPRRVAEHLTVDQRISWKCPPLTP